MRILTGCLIAALAGSVALAEPLALRSGDRVVLVGNTVIERAQNFGHVETLLSLAAGEDVTGLTFRNLGWSGDSVFGDARSYFGPPKEGRDRLQRAIGEAKPTVLLVCYGANAAMTPEKGWTNEPTAAARSQSGHDASLNLFVEGYGTLLDLMEESAGDGLRQVVLISPPPLENMGAPWPDQSENNRRLADYRDAIRDLADTRGYHFVDLFAAMGGDRSEAEKLVGTHLTTNGVHYSEAGYVALGEALVRGLEMSIPSNLSGNDPGLVALRETVKKKNRLFFHKWRPANETYLFLFRKHEQGNNAKEIPMFDPLIEAEEEKIETLRAKLLNKLNG